MNCQKLFSITFLSIVLGCFILTQGCGNKRVGELEKKQGKIYLDRKSIVAIFNFIEFPPDYVDPLGKVRIWAEDWQTKRGVSAGARRYMAHRKEFKNKFDGSTPMKHTTFTIIDIKTAAGDPAAIRQIDIVKHIDSKVVWNYTTKGDPDGGEKPSPFQDAASHIFQFIHGEIVVSYGPSARQAIEAAYQGTGLECPESQWIDCRQVIRRIWPRLSSGGDEMENACGMIRYSYIPGDALQDAQACRHRFSCCHQGIGHTAKAWVKLVGGEGENEVDRNN